MKFTKSWLEEHTNINTSIEELCEDLTMAGLEVDEITPLKNDFLIDVDLTPNRSDCLSVTGIARELYCINNNYSQKKTNAIKEKSASCELKNLKLNINDKKICPRFSYMFLENVEKNFETPKVIAKNLKDIGIGLVNPLVDILNYINIDLGQPMHAYDIDKLKGEISIRFSKKGEKFEALDGKEYELGEKNIVICDENGIISLAGIIGAKHCAISSSTKNALIESAFFPPDLMANKARELKLQTESSQRFERGVDFDLPKNALILLQNIISKYSLYKFSDIEVYEDKNHLPKPHEVEIDFEKIRKVLGIDISNKEIETILSSLGCNYDKKSRKAQNPSYRFDLEIHSDYVEEVGRLFGYDNIPIISEKIDLKVNKDYLPISIKNQIKDYLYKSSFSECINYSFTNEETSEDFDWRNVPYIHHKKISNFMSSEQIKLRSNISSSLIKNIEHNINMNPRDSYRFFEISKIYGSSFDNILTCVVYGNKFDESWMSNKDKFDRYDMISIVEDISNIFGLKKDDILYEIYHISRNEREYIVLSISMDKFIEKIKNNSQERFKNLVKFPNIRRDLSFLIDASVSYKEICKLVEEINVHSLKKILLFDLYTGKGIPDGKKSLGVGFIFQDERKTLTHEVADQNIEKILNNLIEKFNIELRK